MKENVIVKASSIHGKGAFANKVFKKGDIILKIDDSNVITDEFKLSEKERDWLDFLEHGKKILMKEPERYINHSCEPNTYEKTIESTRNLIAMRDIKEGEEITYDYAINGYGGEPWDCKCDSNRCRKTPRADFFSLPKLLQREYLLYLDDWFRECFYDELRVFCSSIKGIKDHIQIIKELFKKADKQGITLWLENGWAIDARLVTTTREHEDIDVVYIREQEIEYKKLIQQLGFEKYKRTDYGFLMWKDGILLDSEPCFRIEEEYNFKGFPKGSCPTEKQGLVDNYEVRCISWDAMYFEFLGYREEIPKEKWRTKDFESLRIIENQLDMNRKKTLRNLYRTQKQHN